MTFIIAEKDSEQALNTTLLGSTEKFFSAIHAEIEGAGWRMGCLVLESERSDARELAACQDWYASDPRSAPHKLFWTEWDVNSRHLEDYASIGNRLEQYRVAHRFLLEAFRVFEAASADAGAVIVSIQPDSVVWATFVTIRNETELSFVLDRSTNTADEHVLIGVFDPNERYEGQKPDPAPPGYKVSDLRLAKISELPPKK